MHLNPTLNGATCGDLIALRVTRALYEAWAFLPKLLCLHYSNPVAAAFNYSTEAGSRGTNAKKDREGKTVGVCRDER